MGGWVYVMEQSEFDNWLSGNVSGQTPVEAGRELFETKLGCASCHAGGPLQRGAKLEGIFNHDVKLVGGQTVKADEEYIKNSILNPSGQVVEGFQPIMPTFKGQVTEEQLLSLVAYIKSLSGDVNANSTTAPGAPAASPATSNTANTSSRTPANTSRGTNSNR
jgi:cytochrome c oxidase subunit 2